MGVKVITGPSQVITTADLKLHIRAFTNETGMDDMIAAYLLAAHAFAEHYTQRSIGSQTLELALDEWPAGPIMLPRGKVTSITSLKYIDEDEVEQTIASGNYTLDDYSIPCWLIPDVDYEWPSHLSSANAIKVRYVAGDLPDAVKSALLLMVGHFYEHPEAVGASVMELPLGVRALLDTVKDYTR